MNRFDEQLAHQVGRVVKRARLSRHLTQYELAHRSGIDPTTPNLIESGQRGISLKMLLHLAQALEISPTQFLSEILNELAQSK